MLMRLASLFACAALIGAAAPVPASPGLQGNWANTKNTVHIRLRPCGQALCGTVTWAAPQQRADAKKGSGRELVGSQLLQNLVRSDDGTWRGKVYVPDIDSSVSATVTQVDGDTIRISGCTVMGLVCKTQHWHRIR